MGDLIGGLVTFLVLQLPLFVYALLISIKPQAFRRLVFRLLLIFWLATLCVGGFIAGIDGHPFQWPAAFLCGGVHWALLGGAFAWLYERNRQDESSTDMHGELQPHDRPEGEELGERT